MSAPNLGEAVNAAVNKLREIARFLEGDDWPHTANGMRAVADNLLDAYRASVPPVVMNAALDAIDAAHQNTIKGE